MAVVAILATLRLLQSWCCKTVCEYLFYFIFILVREEKITYGILTGKSLEKFS
jgi:hypothetical protein